MGTLTTRKNINGLVMVAAALAIISVVIAMIADREVELRREQIRAQGTSLANALSRVPLARLVPADRHVGPLSLIRATQTSSSLAYAAIVSNAGEMLDVVSSSGLLPPPFALSQDPAVWTSDRLVKIDGTHISVREFVAPVLEGGLLVAHVRIGFAEPSYGQVLHASSFHASVALLVFMMFPFAYIWLRREIRPLREVAQSLGRGADAIELRIDPGADPSHVIENIILRFRAFSEEIETKANLMSRERMALLASTKVVTHEKNRLQALFKAIPDSILMLDETGKVTIVNGRAESVLRKSREELVGSSPTKWCPWPELIGLIGRYSKSGGRLLRAEGVEFSSDELGQRRFVASVHPLSSGSGVVVIIRDITHEFAARKTQAEFLAHMAHELKAPLNVMSMYSESLLGPEASDEAFRIDACNIIMDEIDRLNGLINNIFSIGRIESGSVTLDRQRVRIRELLEDVFGSVARGGDDQSLEFELNIPDSMKPIFADKHLLSVAIKNLLTNAIKYNRPGGKVSLSAEEQEAGLLISVSDSGIGIPEEDLDRVFEKFYRSEDDSVRKVAGHGLGLALVKEIAALHGIEIRVKSTLGEGSEFSFFFSSHSATFQEKD